MNQSERVLVAEKVTKRYGRRQILQEVSLRVRAGEVLGLLGHNGSGKTTLLSILAGMEKPDSGEVRLMEGAQRIDLKPATVACLLGKPAFYPDLSGLENLKVFGRIRGLRGADFESRCRALLADFGLERDQNRKVKEYSEGMRQRLGLLRTLLHDPQVLLLDEPTNALDPEGFQLVRHVVLEQSKQFGRIVVMASHRLGEVEEACDQVLLLNHGHPARYDSTSAVLDGLASEFTLQASDPEGTLAILRERGCSTASVSESRVQFNCARSRVPELLRALLLGGISIYELSRLTSGLESLIKP
jgi:ABC-type multidrug transport system ATPase subunit